MQAFELGPFSVQELQAVGGMAQVWRGIHRLLGLPVAIKLMSGRYARDSRYLELFRNEVRAVAGLNHPHIIYVYDYGETSPAVEAATQGAILQGQPYLVMEYVGGGSLDRCPPASTWSELRTILLEILRALAHAHARGVVHLDLKPANVLCAGPQDARRGLKLSDFGIARLLPEALAGASAALSPESQPMAGTPAFMAPEQFSGRWRDYGPWTDLYALGCLTYALACGRPPFLERELYALMWAHCRLPPPDLQPALVVPAGLESWIHRLLAKAPADRFQCAADAAHALLALDMSSTLVIPFSEHGRLPPDATAVTSRPSGQALEPLHSTPPPPLLRGAGLSLFHLRTVPLVAREHERAALWNAVSMTRQEGRARLVLLEGPSGSGKSRLVQWLAEQVAETGLSTVLRAHHTPARSTSDGLTRMCAEHLRTSGLDRVRIRERVVGELLRLGIEDDYETEALTELLAPTPLPSPNAAPVPTEEGVLTVRLASPQERYAVLRRYLERLSKERPLLLWLEDVQWGFDALAFAESVLQTRGKATPLLFVLTVQPEALAENPDERSRLEKLLTLPGAEKLNVGPLPPKAQRQLVQEQLGLEASLAQRVTRRTAGNPLFAVQLVGSWVQRGLLEVRPQGFTLKSGGRIALPEDLDQVWRSRIARLLEQHPPSAQECLEIAVALGTELALDEWEAVCGLRGLPSPRPLLESLLSHRLLQPSERSISQGGGAPERWSFVHEMLRATVEQLSRTAGRWQSLHLTCAQSLIERSAQGLLERSAQGLNERSAQGLPPSLQSGAQTSAASLSPELVDRLSRHYLAAEDWESALAPLLKAARIRFDRAAPEEIKRLLRLWEGAITRLKLPASDERWGEGRLAQAHFQAMCGQFDASILSIRQLEHTAREHGWTRTYPAAVLLRGRIAQSRDDVDQAEEAVAVALPRFVALGEAQRIAECLRLQGTCARVKGDFPQATQLLTEAHDLFKQVNALDGQAWCLTQLGRVEARALRPIEARRYFEGAYELHRSAGFQRGMASCMSDIAELYLEGEPARAVPFFERSIALFERVHDITGLARAANNLGEALRLLDRLDDARQAYEKALELYKGAGTPRIGGTRVNLAMIDLKLNRYEKAREHLVQALPELRLLNEAAQFPSYYAARLGCAAGLGHWLEWDELFPLLVLSLKRAPLFPQDVWALVDAERVARSSLQTARSTQCQALLASLPG